MPGEGFTHDSGPEAHQKIATMTPSIYETLPGGPDDQFIRLCSLYPGTGDEPLRIEFQLCQLDSDDVAKYEAVSWVWGLPSDNNTKLLYNGREIPIRRNLSDALRAFRYTDRPRVLWVDALCINQDNLQERSHQVSFMGSIYKRASGVLIWMGNDKERQAAIAFGELRRCIDYYNLAAGKETFHMLSDDEIEQLDVSGWNSIKSFFTNEWFYRVWVQQEHGLNENGTFYWGSSSISTKTISVISNWLCWNARSGSSVMSKPLCRSAFVALQTYGLAETFRFAYPVLSFLDLLYLNTALVATDPRDYIYGFLGHPSAKRMFDPQQQLIVTPDYNKTIDEVYMDTTVALLQDPGNGLQVLAFVHHSPVTLASGSPSWAVRLHNKAALSDLLETNSIVNGDSEFLGGKRWHMEPPLLIGQRNSNIMFNAGLLRSEGFEIVEERISITGILVDRVESVWKDPVTTFLILWVAALQNGELSAAPARMAPPLGFVFDTMMTWLNNNTSPYTNLVLAAALTLSCGQLEMPRTRRAIDHLDEFKRNVVAFCVRILNIDSSFSFTDAYLASPDSFESVVKGYCGRRTLLRSNQGFLALAPLLADEGDYIAVFAGAEVPFIIRPTSEGTYKLVGECYVEGIMDNEAFDRGPVTTITLV